MSTVIKAGKAGPILPHLTTVDLADHLAEARFVVEAARRQAAKLISEGRRTAVALHEQARKKGFESGYAQGHQEGTQTGHERAHQEATERFNEQHAEVVSAFEHATAEIGAMKEELQTAAEHHLLRFATDVAVKLTFAIGALHRESAKQNLRRAISAVGEQTDLTVRVHPADLEVIRDFAPSALEQAGASPHVNVVADEGISPGGCAVRTARSEVDATLETQVAEIVALLLGGEANDA